MPDNSPTAKLRAANLLTALHDNGFSGGQAKTAARLLDVRYDEATDEPTNLPAALSAAKAIYGDVLAGSPGTPIPDDLHGGAGLAVDEDAQTEALLEVSRRRMGGR